MLERHAANLWAAGAVEDWFHGCEPGVRGVARTVNGPLLADLVKMVDHCDHEVAELPELLPPRGLEVVASPAGGRACHGREARPERTVPAILWETTQSGAGLCQGTIPA